MIDRFLVTKPSRIRRNLMKNCTNIEQDVPYSIPEAPGADSGAKRPKNQKNVTRKISGKIGKQQKKTCESCVRILRPPRRPKSVDSGLRNIDRRVASNLDRHFEYAHVLLFPPKEFTVQNYSGGGWLIGLIG